jgi:hypothetical protein
MSSTESDNEHTKEEKRRIQLRDAQRRYYATHKKKERPEVPVSYEPDRIRNYHKTYYEENKERLNEKAKERYRQKKEQLREQFRQTVSQPIANLPPIEPIQSIPLILPSQPAIADFERITYNC